MDPGYLIASPQMRDTNFAHTLILLVHHDEKGALGLVINRQTQIRVGDLLEEIEGVDPSRANGTVLWGGPVEPGVGFVIYRGVAEEGWTVGHELAVSASGERLATLVGSGEPFELCVGYAGWGPGQLDREYLEGSWVHLDATADLVFDCPPGERYDRALARMGLRAETLWMSPIDE